MTVDISALANDADLPEFRTMLSRAQYSTENIRRMLAIAEPVETILANTGRYSMLYLNKLAESDTPASILAQLFMLCGRVPATMLERLEPTMAETLQRLGLIETVPEDSQLTRSTVAVIELRGLYFLSDTLFENRTDDFMVHEAAGRCMPPHASSLELLNGLRKPSEASAFLDVGCGTGCQSLLFATGYERAVGFDANPRAVQFAQANAAFNESEARYFVGQWESYNDGERYDHVAFNADDAIEFINYGLDRLLAPGGTAQLWFYCEITADDTSLERTLQRRLLNWDDLDIEMATNPASPFALSAQNILDRRLPYGTLLVSHPSQRTAYFRDLAARRVAEIASVNLTIRRH